MLIDHFLRYTTCLTIPQVLTQRQVLHAESKWLQKARRECWDGHCVEQVPKDFAKQGRRSCGNWTTVLEPGRGTTLSRFSVKGKTFNEKPESEAAHHWGVGTGEKVQPSVQPVQQGNNIDRYPQPQFDLHLCELGSRSTATSL